jgi:RNA polymerase sigma factor (sigma-70 family)
MKGRNEATFLSTQRSAGILLDGLSFPARGAYTMSLEHRTSPSLLGRLRVSPVDEAAWTEFVDRYGAAIYGWCRQQRLQEADAQDVTQGVLTKLAVRLRSFQYDPSQSFRKWLWTVTRHAVIDFCTEQPRHATLEPQVLERLAASNDLQQQLNQAFDQELLSEAYARVEGQVAKKTWQAFLLTAVEGVSGAEVAAKLGMTVGNVYMARCNVQKRLRDELQRLDKP